jgi:hypothetical protein
MHTLTIEDDELQLLHNALETWINSFSHDQPELLRAGKVLRAKLDAELATPAGAAIGGDGDAYTVI